MREGERGREIHIVCIDYSPAHSLYGVAANRARKAKNAKVMLMGPFETFTYRSPAFRFQFGIVLPMPMLSTLVRFKCADNGYPPHSPSTHCDPHTHTVCGCAYKVWFMLREIWSHFDLPGSRSRSAALSLSSKRFIAIISFVKFRFSFFVFSFMSYYRRCWVVGCVCLCRVDYILTSFEIHTFVSPFAETFTCNLHIAVHATSRFFTAE